MQHTREMIDEIYSFLAEAAQFSAGKGGGGGGPKRVAMAPLH